MELNYKNSWAEGRENILCSTSENYSCKIQLGLPVIQLLQISSYENITSEVLFKARTEIKWVIF